MAHCEKYTVAAIGHMCNHYERGGNVKRSNENIDSERTGLNYNLGPAREQSQVEFIRERVAEVRCQKRADVNVMVDWVVTIPQDFIAAHPEREREFFERSYEFIADRYGGEKNIISAYVHKDETTPHMHCAFIPITADKRRGGEKVCANDVITRADLRTFHGDLQAHLERTLGVEVGILNGATKDGNEAIEELKRGTAQNQIADMKDHLNRLSDRIVAGNERLIAITEAYEARKAFLDSPAIQTMVQPQKRFKSGLFGTGEEMVTLRAADFDRLQQQAAEVKKCREFCDTAVQHYNDWVTKSYSVVNESLKKDVKIKKLEKQLEDSKAENSTLKADIAALKERDKVAAAVIEQIPAAKVLRDEIIDRKETEKILAYEPPKDSVVAYMHRAKKHVFAELKRQILDEGKTAATLDYGKAAAVLYADNESTYRTAELIKAYTGISSAAANKAAKSARELCNSMGMGMER